MTQQFIKLVTLNLVLQYVLFETAHSSIYGLYQLYFPMQPGNSITNTLIFSFILEQWRHNCFICAKLVTSIIMVNGNIYFCGNYYHYFSIETCNCVKPRAYIIKPLCWLAFPFSLSTLCIIFKKPKMLPYRNNYPIPKRSSFWF